MNKEQVMEKFKEMVKPQLETIETMHDYDVEDIQDILEEVVTVAWVVDAVTDVTKAEMSHYLYSETGYTLKSVQTYLDDKVFA